MDRLLSALVAGLFAVACTTQPPAMLTPRTGGFAFAAHSIQVSGQSRGDAARGRAAFIDLQCYVCHGVTEDPTLPSFEGAMRGPVLHDLDKRSPEEVGWAIVTRTRLDPESVYETPMAEAASAMTEQQLSDLIVYLRDPRPK